MTGALDVSVVIVTWNCARDIGTCLASVVASAPPMREVIVVDNGSSDGTLAKVRRLFPDVTVVANTTNLGHVKAANQGFARASGRYVLILDPDTEFAPDVIPAMVAFLEGEPRAHICAPRLYYADGRLQETNRNLPTASAALFGRRSWLARAWPSNPFTARYLRRDALSLTEPYPVQQVSAACMLFRRDVVARIGAWDEGFLGYWVDSEWCLRANRAGLGVWALPRLAVIHHESNRAGVRKTWRRLWMFHQGAIRLYRLHSCRGPFDPRLWLASALLVGRFALLAVVDPFLPPPRPEAAPAGDEVEGAWRVASDR